jgi:hypothetical protein
MNPKTVKYIYMLLHADLLEFRQSFNTMGLKELHNLTDMTADAYYYICGKL